MRSSTGIKRFAGLLMGGAIALLSMGAQSESAVTQGSRAATMDACVAPTAEMRRNHMDYLKHDRVQSVREGVRDTKNSLVGCVDCHASKDDSGNYKSIVAEGEFCQSCHSYVAVQPACFQCHRKTPHQGHAALGMNQDAAEPALGLLPGISRSDLSELHANVMEH